ncbi:MAG: putative peptide zinc metalloprotease protein, partial [Actinomycetota bacterium]|nr:putative peptide zinc metalloprotease protein [Actinomycetota bacterium]
MAEERAAVGERPPSLAEGVELIGEYEGSGFKEPPSLVRRADGQVIQLPPLLYAVAARSDGAHGYDEIASDVSAEIKRGLDGDQVRFLAEEKLRPLGVLALRDGSTPAVAKPDPFLGLKFRMGVVPERASNALGTMFKPLFFAPVVLAVLGAFVAADAWLFFDHGIAQSLRQSMMHPALFLPMFAAVVVAAGFHEVGHAAACRYGGGSPGKMGCGLYLAWPAFYTDVT